MFTSRTKRYRAKCKREGKCYSCGKLALESRSHCANCQVKVAVQTKVRRSFIKQEVFEAYGNSCQCCGEIEHYFLGIDHIHGNLIKEKCGDKLYLRLLREGFPEGFRLLCHNCNHGRYLNGGICPHEDRSKQQAEFKAVQMVQDVSREEVT